MNLKLNGADKFIIGAGQKKKEQEYWLQKLSGNLVKSSFPRDGEKIIPGEHHLPGKVRLQFPGKTSSQLLYLSNDSHEILHVILAAGLNIMLEKYTGQKDITLAAPIYKQAEEKDFINTVLILRNHLTPGMSFKELLVQVRKTIIEAVEHQNYPVELLAKELNLVVNPGDFPFSDIAVLLENIHHKRYIEHLRWNMIFSFKQTDKTLEGVVEYNELLYQKHTIEQITVHFQHLLQEALLHPDMPLSSLEILPEAEKKQLLFEFNDSRSDFPGQTIHELFEQQAEAAPHRIALVLENSHLTYRALNEQSNRLAHLLRAKGVTAEVIVGVLLDRSFEMMSGFLAILKAGGVYMPLDPEMPQKRIIAMLKDCQARILLTGSTFIESQAFTRFQGLERLRRGIWVTATRPQIKDLDHLPLPDRSLVDYEKYSRYIGQASFKHSFIMQATRGCPYKCAYCHKIWPKNHVFRSAENILEEIQLYYNLGVRRFTLLDDIFNLNPDNSSRFFQLIIKNKMDIQLSFPSGFRGDILTKEYIDLMAEAGVKEVALALETASPRLQKLIRKNLNLEKFRENCDYICKKYPGMMVRLYSMLGFPSETEEEAMMTLNFIMNTRWVQWPYVFNLVIYPYTDMAELAVQNGVPANAIEKSGHLAFHQLPDTLPFDKSFALKYRSDFFNYYFLSKERLKHVLPYQMQFYSEDEMLQQYNVYLPTTISSLEVLLEFLGIAPDELRVKHCKDEDDMHVPGLNARLRQCFPKKKPKQDALKVLLLDLSHFFSGEDVIFFNDAFEQPLGLMVLLSYLNRQLGSQVQGKIAKSRVDFDSYEELKAILEEFKPHLIGIRSMTIYKDFFHYTTAMIRHWGYDIPIIAGGPYATSDYQNLLNDRNVDLAVLGEGEITFCDLVEKIIKNNKKLPAEEVLKSIPGIAFIPGKDHANIRKYTEIILMDIYPEMWSRQRSENLENINCANHLAYVMHTSGSTGKPKATAVEHHSVTGLVKNTNYISLEKEDRILQLSNYAFDGSVFDIYGALLNGSTLIMMKKEEVLAVDRLTDLIKRRGITVFFVTTALFNTLVSVNIECFAGIRKILFGGERVSVEHTRKALDYMGQHRVVHVYGPTETTVYATHYFINTINENQETIPIGKPLANTFVFILSKDHQPVPIGVPGELYIGGNGVSRGYLNEQELTAEKFVELEFNRSYRSYSSYIIYKTGDMVKWLPGGNIRFIGRLDRQVKIRGFRIEMGEIEHRLLNYEGIRETIVVVNERADGDKYLCAYIVTDAPVTSDLPLSPDLQSQGASIFISELKEFLSSELPHFMIPAYFIQLEKMPLTPNGKIDMKALPGPERDEISRRKKAPRDALEKMLTRIWADVLLINNDIIDIDNDFFQLGGHSIKAMMLISKIHKETHVKIPLEQLFATPTVRGISEFIKQQGEPQYKFISILQAEQKEYYPISSAQKRIYFLQQIDLNDTNYNIPMVYRINGELSGERFENVFRSLVKRHESLRTSFEIINREPVQKISADVQFEIEYYKVPEVPENSKETSGLIPGLISSFIRPFDLSAAPLFRAALIKVGKLEHIFMFDMHHIITDGTSHELFVKEFLTVVEGGQLPQLKIRYKDFSQWQHRGLESEEIKKQEEFWLKEFSSQEKIPVIHLPTDYPRPRVQSFAGDQIYFRLTDEETGYLKELARSHEATLFMVSAALFYVMLARLSGQETIIAGTPVVCRRHEDLQYIIGVFINTLALKQYPAGDKSFNRFLAEVKHRTLKAFENQEYPFENLVEKLKLDRDMSRNPLFDVMFAFQNFEAPAIEMPEPVEMSKLNINNYQYENTSAKFDLVFSGSEMGEDLGFYFEFCTELFKKETIRRFIGYYRAALACIGKNPDIKISRVEIISEEEKKQLLVDFNNTRSNDPGNLTLDELFAEQVERRPDNIAVVSREAVFFNSKNSEPGTIALTYRQLDDQSNHLVGLLRENGIMTGEIVGLLAEPSIKMLVGMLAILKAGGAYLPIAMGYPTERINYLLADSGARFLLVTSGAVNMVRGTITKANPIFIDQVMKPSLPAPNHLPVSSLLSQQPHRTRQNLAYVIYTSGSTGKPKGVMVEHGNVASLVKNPNFIQWTTGDKLLLTGAVIFDITTFEIWGPLLNGIMLFLADQADIIDGKTLKTILEKNKISILHLIPGLFNQMMEKHPGLFTGLHYFLVGGDLVRPHYINQLRNRYQDLKILHMYGPTENTTFSTFFPVDKDYDTLIPIGKPINNSTVYIVDKYFQWVPVGVVGELCVGGDGVARGYLNHPELTAEKFCLRRPGGTLFEKTAPPGPPRKNFLLFLFYSPHYRIYRTGDLARWLPDGNIEFLGRIDHQVKIRGFRIEPGEIEYHLLSHKEIENAVVIESSDDERDNYLSAYIVSQKALDASQLREFLSGVLPGYMIPSIFIQLDEIPETTTGKVDRRTLRKYTGKIKPGAQYVPPANESEEIIANAWKQLLGLERVGRNDNFFELGGTSLDIISLNSQFKEIFARDIPVVVMLRYTTIAALAKYLEDGESIVPVQPRDHILDRGIISKKQRLQMRKEMTNE